MFVFSLAAAAAPSLGERAKKDLGIGWKDVREAAEGQAAARQRLRQWAGKEDPQKILNDLREKIVTEKKTCTTETKSIRACDDALRSSNEALARLEKAAASFISGSDSARAFYWAFVVWRHKLDETLLQPAEKEWARGCKGPKTPDTCRTLLEDYAEIDELSRDLLAYDRRLFGESAGSVDAKALKERVKKYE